MATTRAPYIEAGQRAGLKFLLTETTPASIENQIALHEAAILDHHREIQAWKALLACVRGLSQAPATCVSTQPPVVNNQLCTRAAVKVVFERLGRPLRTGEIAAEVPCSPSSAYQCLARYPDTFEQVERGLYRLKAG